ncbi:MAG: pyridoxamine 5'-phosphate oxidase [Gammaproteobacteria bacterium]|nr:pyridoxamine 5'-phosphate oxidase [Gammaproteobacteria bacterium]
MDFTHDLLQLRQEYVSESLEEGQVPPSPYDLFASWLTKALATYPLEANAMTLSTVSARGQPSSRVVLLKKYDQQGLVWFTNYQSKKGRELAENPLASLQFYWSSLHRVVRIEGRTEKLSQQENERYFSTRPLESQQSAWVSPQSQVLTTKAELVEKIARLSNSLQCPDYWGGYQLVPHYWEFWQGGVHRLHDRLIYELQDAGDWRLSRLAP